MKHKHADLMLQYAQDAMITDRPWELWESRPNTLSNTELGWMPCTSHLQFSPEREYRRKPNMNINGFAVPSPRQTLPTIDTVYWVPNILSESDYARQSTYKGLAAEYLLFSRGLIHLTKEAAESHAKALLSFTNLNQE